MRKAWIPAIVLTALAAFMGGCNRKARAPIAAAVSATPADPAPQPVLGTLVFFGDSLTAGLGLSKEQAFPALIDARLRAEGRPWKVVNAGLSGDTTAGGVARLDWIYKQKVDVMFLCLGANDGLRGMPVVETERNLRTILDRAKREGTRVVLAGIQLPENYGPEDPGHLRRDLPAPCEGIPRAAAPFPAGRCGHGASAEPARWHPSHRRGCPHRRGPRLDRAGSSPPRQAVITAPLAGARPSGTPTPHGCRGCGLPGSFPPRTKRGSMPSSRPSSADSPKGTVSVAGPGAEAWVGWRRARIY